MKPVANDSCDMRILVKRKQKVYNLQRGYKYLDLNKTKKEDGLINVRNFKVVMSVILEKQRGRHRLMNCRGCVAERRVPFQICTAKQKNECFRCK